MPIVTALSAFGGPGQSFPLNPALFFFPQLNIQGLLADEINADSTLPSGGEA